MVMRRKGGSYSLLILVRMSRHRYLLEVGPVVPPVVHVEEVNGARSSAGALPLDKQRVLGLAGHVHDAGWGRASHIRLDHYCVRGLPFVLPSESLYPELVLREWLCREKVGSNWI